MRTFVAILLLVHGLITSAQAQAGFRPSEGVANPSWLSWFPVNLGQSWLFKSIGMPKPFIGTLLGIFWIIAGTCLVAAALSLFGVIVPTNLWRPIAAIGAIISLVLFVFYFHPFYAIGIAADIAILIVLLWAKWPTPELLGS